jgi:two-component system, OmpR family, osmolarity sensor histidine kinase EnvZ
MRTYLETIRSKLAADLDAPEVRINRYAGPAELWLRTRDVPDEWLVLTWRVAGPNAPVVSFGLMASAAVLVLGAAAFSARRLTAPLAALATATTRVAEGERVQIDTTSGPSEVRALAVAFRSMSQRLAELDEQREMLLGGVSHDLRTPLARLRVAVELLGSEPTSLTEEMTANIEEMDRMIGRFLHYVRANYRETPTRASLDEIARQTLAIYATDERLRFELRAPAQRTFAADCVRHALLNLVQNALEYGTAPVTVTTASDATGLCIQVADRGPGLSETEWVRALEPFRRLRDQPGGSHSGLGLALVERLVRVSGGSLEARRTEGGFVVTVRLPAHDA